MAETDHGFRWVNRTARVCLVGVWILLALGVIACIALIVNAVLGGWAWARDAVWVVALPVALLLAGCAAVGYGLVLVLTRIYRVAERTHGRLDRLESVVEDQHALTRELVELARMSEQAKSLLYRDRELEAFRETIHTDIIRQDYASAEILIDALEQRYGRPDEAAELREQIEESRNASLSEKIDAAISRVNDLIVRRNWSQALREAERIAKLFPDNTKVAALPDRIENARSTHKRELLQKYGEAVRKNDIDRSIDLLRELDGYLTPQEAAALEESARGVFKAKLHNLGVQFAIFVTEGQWNKAIETGEEIVQEFPNSRMAREVSEKMDQLRARASAAQG
jgi:tetratricopeptide (TPR) repeat protein